MAPVGPAPLHCAPCSPLACRHSLHTPVCCRAVGLGLRAAMAGVGTHCRAVHCRVVPKCPAGGEGREDKGCNEVDLNHAVPPCTLPPTLAARLCHHPAWAGAPHCWQAAAFRLHRWPRPPAGPSTGSCISGTPAGGPWPPVAPTGARTAHIHTHLPPARPPTPPGYTPCLVMTVVYYYQ